MDLDYELRTLEAEDRHWWYRGRQRIVLDAVERLAAGRRAPRILDAGCGGGATLVPLAELGPVTGLEPSAPSREKAAARGVAEVLDGSVLELPFPDDSFDLALILDVLEHLPDDRAALAELRRVVVPGGGLVVTVPGHPRLWSSHDEVNHHFRRYTRRALADAAQRSGWEVRRATYFMSAVLPAAVAARAVDAGDGLDVPARPINGALQGTITAEAALIRRGARLPFGLSLLAELRRN